MESSHHPAGAHKKGMSTHSGFSSLSGAAGIETFPSIEVGVGVGGSSVSQVGVLMMPAEGVHIS